MRTTKKEWQDFKIKEETHEMTIWTSGDDINRIENFKNDDLGV